MTQGKKYWTTEMYLILHTKAFVGDDSFKTSPEGETITCIAQVWFSLQILKVLWVSSMNSDL